nr:hypothetical protein GCM10020093_103360 [Planobispora longispora]
MAEALEELLASWSGRTGITVETWALPGRRVPARVARGVLVAVEEALSNVERHSRARSVSVAVTAGQDSLKLTVSDGGVGFSRLAFGRGSAAMRTAFAELGGVLTVNGTPGGGTTVSGVVPLRDR